MGGEDKKTDNKNAVQDLINYKGIYFEDDTGQKYTCPETGAHFEYLDMYRRLKKVASMRNKEDKEENENDGLQQELLTDEIQENVELSPKKKEL